MVELAIFKKSKSIWQMYTSTKIKNQSSGLLGWFAAKDTT